MIHTIGNVLVVLSAIPAVLSVAAFSRVDWRASMLGRHFMTYMSTFALVLVLNVVRILIGTHPLFENIRLIVFVLVPIVMWWRLVLLIILQRAGGSVRSSSTSSRDDEDS